MRPALYWVIRFEDGTYEYRDMIRDAIRKTDDPWCALAWASFPGAAAAAKAYRALGRRCRVIRRVRKEPAK
jgi:hypothetical protein